MKTKLFYLIFCLVLTTIGSIFFAQNIKELPPVNATLSGYAELWKNVERDEKAALPQSALENINAIYEKALKEKNSPQLIKSLIYKMKMKLEINNDDFPQLIKEIEIYTGKDTDVVERSVLHSILANLYSQYYRSNSYTINERTAIAGPATEDIREWPGNIFMEKIVEHAQLSIQAGKELQATKVSQYADILNMGNSSQNLRPTMYDFLINQAINLFAVLSTNYNQTTNNFFQQTKLEDTKYFAPVLDFIDTEIFVQKCDFVSLTLQFYQKLLAFHYIENNKEALVLTDLDRLNYVHNNINSVQAKTAYIKALEELSRQYEDYGFCVEILFKQANYYIQLEPETINSEKQLDVEKEMNGMRYENYQKAYEICSDGINRYPNYERINLLKNLKNDLTSSYANVQAPNTVYPEKELELKIRYRNVNKLGINIYKISSPVTEYRDNWSRNGLYKKSGSLIEKKEISLTNTHPYQDYDTIIKIPVKSLGCYEYVVYMENESQNVANQQFSVSKLAAISRTMDSGREFLVVDRISGKPIPGAKVNFYKQVKNNIQPSSSVITNKSGLALGNADNSISFYNITLGEDSFSILSPVPWSSTYQEPNMSIDQLYLFTDRNIYRPGQTVFLKGIAGKLSQNEQKIIAGKSFQLTLRDANYKELVTKTFRTNEFGSFSGEFVLPQNVLNGIFSISSNETFDVCSFRVEEYKRPTFDIRFLPDSGTYNFGDKVTVKGIVKTFSGVSLQNAEVRYRVIQRPHWFSYVMRNTNQIAEGVAVTKDNGSFEVSFEAERLVNDRTRKNVFYIYEIEASVTDTNGETQTSRTNISIGDKSMFLVIDGIEDRVNKDDSLKMVIKALNLSNNPVETEGTYEIYKLKSDGKLTLEEKEDTWTIDKEVVSGNFSSWKDLDINTLKNIESGKYRIIVKAKDNKDREITSEKDFILSSVSDKRPPAPVYEWLLTPKTTCSVGEKAEIIYGSSAQNVYVLYDIFKNGKKLSSSRFELNNENKKIEIPFLESYGNGVVVSFTFIKDSHVFTQNVEIKRKQPDKNLTLNMEIFRDKLLPGQKEEWKISVKDADKKPVLSEILAGMYDASLDKIYSHAWSFNPTYHVGLWSPYFQHGMEFNHSNTSVNRQLERLSVPEFSYDSFNWFGLNLNSARGRVLMFGKSHTTRTGAVMKSAPMELNESIELQDSNMAEAVPQAAKGEDGFAGNANTSEQSVQIRENFNETAFFYPQLKTNEAGETLISFTVPESNTTWKFMGIAHTKDLKYGQIMKEAVSQKKLMVTPNMPRFIRHGDKMTIATNISNLSNENIDGTVEIECFDPGTNKANIIIPDYSKKFSVEQGKTTAVFWTFDVPSDIDMAACKIIAKATNFSDGEQHLLPVLPNRMLVTESLPLDVLGKQTKEYSFNKLSGNSSKTLTNYRLTLEFASNPTWYAVQALPSMTTPENENVISWFSAYYSNILATYIANNTPKIKQIIEAWTQQGGTKETLLSNLEKNQELKAVLLEETPWVLEAKNETEQKQLLALLFDINRANNLGAVALEKLKSLQLQDGGFSWFKGMYSSPSITQWLLYGMGQLSQLKSVTYDEDIKNMQRQAIGFIDLKFKENFDNMKRYNKNWKKTFSISTYQLEYLFVRSFYKDIPFGEADEAAKFYSEIAEKYWMYNSNLYSRAITAILMQRTGKEAVAQNMLKSLRQYASHKEGLGMYWANNNANAFMFQSATAVHTFIMEAFNEIGSTPQEMDEMKLWLLKQKQTQLWESTPATVNSIYILLKTGNNWLENAGKVDIQLGKHEVQTGNAEIGTGYFKKVYDAQAITPDMNNVKITKEDEGPAYGALYWQYFEDLDKITQAKTGLNVEKSLFIEKTTNTGKILEKVTPANPLKTGDKVVVRLTVRNNRDMEFVMLKDMRGSCFEPVEQLSGTHWKEKVVYYQSSKDASMNFYFHSLPKGTYVFEYPLYVTRSGEYSNGISTIQCMYAPEFVSHTAGERVVVK